jgi:hypothetical protein
MEKLLKCLVLQTLVLWVSPSFAGSNTLFADAEVTVYSGPSSRFRPLLFAKQGDQFPVSKKIVSGKEGGEFYKVLIRRKGPARVGFIATESAVRLEKKEEAQADSDDVDSYVPFSQAESSFQVGFSALKDSNFVWSVGYAKHLAPDFYLEFILGQLLYKRASSPMGGLQVGFDQSAFDQFSLYTLLSMGVVNVPVKDDIFPGSQSLSFFSQGGMGIRYTADETAAISFGILQIAIFSPNGSYLSPGASVTLEVGL